MKLIPVFLVLILAGCSGSPDSEPPAPDASPEAAVCTFGAIECDGPRIRVCNGAGAWHMWGTCPGTCDLVEGCVDPADASAD